LHTGVFYYNDVASNSIKCVSFCTTSESLRHDAAAIWAHLQPILQLIKNVVPSIKNILFQSDGPTTQYKNKTNFYLFHHFCNKLQIETASWNFSTPGHGKSSADATGGTVKKLCDQFVLKGNDIVSVDNFVQAVTRSSDKIKIFPITLSDIEEIDKLIEPNLTSAPNSNKIFQLLWSKSSFDTLYSNYLSCFECFNNLPCSHYSVTKWSVNNVCKKVRFNQNNKKKDNKKLNNLRKVRTSNRRKN